MKTTLVILFVVLSKITFCQTLEDLKKNLEKKDFTQLKHTVRNFKADHCGPPKEITNREILNEYNEVVTEALIFEPTPHGKYAGKSNYYQINLLTKDNLIIKYTLYAKYFNKSTPDDLKLLKDYSNDTAVKAFQELYEKVFYRKLSITELFDISVTYGDHCGWGGINPKARDTLSEYVTTENREKLFYWLTSPSFEKKLYGYEGFKALENKGYKLSQKENAIVGDLKNFKGPVRTCSGCIFSSLTISEIIDQLNGNGFDVKLKK